MDIPFGALQRFLPRVCLGKRCFLRASPARITQGSEPEQGIFLPARPYRLLSAQESLQALGNSFGATLRLSWGQGKIQLGWTEPTTRELNQQESGGGLEAHLSQILTLPTPLHLEETLGSQEGENSISQLRSSSVPCRRAAFQCPINLGDVSRKRRGGQE